MNPKGYSFGCLLNVNEKRKDIGIHKDDIQVLDQFILKNGITLGSDILLPLSDCESIYNSINWVSGMIFRYFDSNSEYVEADFGEFSLRVNRSILYQMPNSNFFIGDRVLAKGEEAIITSMSWHWKDKYYYFKVHRLSRASTYRFRETDLEHISQGDSDHDKSF